MAALEQPRLEPGHRAASYSPVLCHLGSGNLWFSLQCPVVVTEPASTRQFQGHGRSGLEVSPRATIRRLSPAKRLRLPTGTCGHPSCSRAAGGHGRGRKDPGWGTRGSYPHLVFSCSGHRDLQWWPSTHILNLLHPVSPSVGPGGSLTPTGLCFPPLGTSVRSLRK